MVCGAGIKDPVPSHIEIRSTKKLYSRGGTDMIGCGVGLALIKECK